MTNPTSDSLLAKTRADFEEWIPAHNHAPIKWIGHSYANAYMAAQWEGWKAAHDKYTVNIPFLKTVQQFNAHFKAGEDKSE